MFFPPTQRLKLCSAYQNELTLAFPPTSQLAVNIVLVLDEAGVQLTTHREYSVDLPQVYCIPCRQNIDDANSDREDFRHRNLY